MSFLTADLLISFFRVLIWTTAAYLIGIILGYFCYAGKLLRQLLLPIINFFRHISPFCWIPLIILFAGIGEWPVGIVLLLSMLFNATIISIGIFRQVQQDILDTASLDGAEPRQVFRFVLLPLCIPELLNLFRILWSVGWSAIIAAEMLGVRSGLGYRLLDFRYLLQYREMLFYIGIIGTIGIITDYGLLTFHKRIKDALFGI